MTSAAKGYEFSSLSQAMEQMQESEQASLQSRLGLSQEAFGSMPKHESGLASFKFSRNEALATGLGFAIGAGGTATVDYGIMRMSRFAHVLTNVALAPLGFWRGGPNLPPRPTFLQSIAPKRVLIAGAIAAAIVGSGYKVYEHLSKD